jgi:hypothetical protein
VARKFLVRHVFSERVASSDARFDRGEGPAGRDYRLTHCSRKPSPSMYYEPLCFTAAEMEQAASCDLSAYHANSC